MSDDAKTREELLAELRALRARVAELEGATSPTPAGERATATALQSALLHPQNARPKRRHGAVLYPMSNEAVLLAPTADRAFFLNPSALAIWELCDGTRNVQDMLRELQGRYNASESDLLLDLRTTLEQLDQRGLIDLSGRLVTVIGRGHGGTRAMSHTLYASGVHMGDPLNKAGDLLPPGDMYEACRVFASRVTHRGGLDWDFSKVLAGPLDPAFTRLIESYLRSVLNAPSATRGWKIPETTLCWPWVIKMFPDAHFIVWTRDPRDAILGPHKTDDLAEFGVEYDKTEDVFRRRAISWYYQWALIKATPRPAKCLEVRFEDFVLKQEETLKRLEAFLGIPLARIVVHPHVIGRWKSSPDHRDFDFLSGPLRELGYSV